MSISLVERESGGGACVAREEEEEMPDVWTKHPEIVRDLLKEGGFTCGVAPRVLKGRDPAWTCIIDGKRIRGDIYIHHVDKLRKELGMLDSSLPLQAGIGAVGDWAFPALVLLVAVIVAQWLAMARLRGRGPESLLS